MEKVRIIAALLSLSTMMSLLACGTDPSDGADTTAAVTTEDSGNGSSVKYESVKMTVSDAFSADITISGTPNASVEGKVGILNGESGEWSYSEYSEFIGKDGSVSFSVELPEGTVEIEVMIERAAVSDGTEMIDVEAAITEVVPVTEKPLIKAPVESITSTLPTVGDVKVLAFYVEFPDKTFRKGALSAEKLQEELFGEGKAKFPYDSVSAWFERSSYGNLHMTGDVYYYTCKHEMAHYENGNYEELVMEVMRGLDDEIDYSEYDSDGDHYIDNISFTVPLDGADQARLDYWYGKTLTWYENPSFRLDRVMLRQYVCMDVMPYTSDMVYLKQTLIHEMGHCMGLPDYYKYGSSDWEGLHGDAGIERMDDSLGDFCAFSKLMLGWFRENEVQVYEGEGEQTFKLRSSSNEASCVILPISDSLNGYKSEYFIIEFVTADNNNADLKTNAASRNRSGIRVFHVQAETAQMDWGSKEFKYNNYSQYYKGDDKIRVLKLVNDGGNMLRKGDTVEFGDLNFGGYDKRGNTTIDTGYRIEIGELTDGTYTVTVTR